MQCQVQPTLTMLRGRLSYKRVLCSFDTARLNTRNVHSIVHTHTARTAGTSQRWPRMPSFCRRLSCSTLALELQQIQVAAKLNSMAGPLTPHPEEVGHPIDLVLHPEVQLMQQHLTLNSRHLTLVVPRSIDAILDMYIARNQGDRDPYWCRPWPSAIALAQLILQQPELVKGKRVCDIGCGLGLAGIAAALSGAKEVVMLDREPIALQCSLLSAQACGVTSVQNYRHHEAPVVTPSQQHQRASLQDADAASDSSRSSSQQHASTSQVRAEHFDWHDPSCRGSYDVALACDVLYEPYSVEPLANFVPRLVNPKSGRLLLADPSHRTEQNRSDFLRLISGQPKSAMLLQESSEVTIRMDAQDTLVQLQLLRMKVGQETVGLKLSAKSH